MCKPIKEYLGVLRDYKDIILTFAGIIASIYIYTDFKTVVREQSESASKTAEILRTIDYRLANLENKQR